VARIVGLVVGTLIAGTAVAPPASAATVSRTIVVPTESPTIQSAINSASSGDVIFVLPGTYRENITYLGKNIWLVGFGPGVTTIEGTGKGPVVSFTHGETSAAGLRGFTIRGGYTDPLTLTGGGVRIADSSPTIIGNQITHNHGIQGVGIGVMRGNPVIWANEISYNTADSPGLTNGFGGGIYLSGNYEGPPTTVAYNIIAFNAADQGGAIGTNDAGDVYMVGNVMVLNQAYYDGGAFFEGNTTKPHFVSNLIAYNTAGDGSVMYLSPVVTTPTEMLGNIVAGNYSSSIVGGNGQGVGFRVVEMTINMSHNYIAGEANHTLFQCQEYPFPSRLTFDGDTVSAPGGALFDGCTHVTGL